jgi:signal peptidase I
MAVSMESYLHMSTDVATPRPLEWLRVAVIGRNPKRTLVRVGVWVVICLVVFKFMLLPAWIDGTSMAPTYRGKGLTFVNRLAYLFREPRRGDVVAIATSGTDIMYMKRIVGLPGETIAFRGGRAFINGHMLDEPYVKVPCDWELEPETLGPEQYYFAGDNRSMPRSEHKEGRQYRQRIVGKILL